MSKRCLILLFLLIPSILFSESISSYEFTTSPTCPYSGRSYMVPCKNTDLCGVKKLGWLYDYGDCTPCEYNTKAIRDQILPLIYHWIDKLNGVEKENDLLFYSNMLQFRAYYTFKNSPDFVLLKYRIDGDTDRIIFVGYIKSSGKIYLLTDGYSGTLEDNFNRMIEENGNILNIDPVHKAALLVKLKYIFNALVVASNFDNMLMSNIILYEQNKKIPLNILPYDLLFIIDPGTNKTLSRYFTEQDIEDGMIGYVDEKLVDTRNAPNKEKTNYLPPIHKQYAQKDVVVLSVYNGYYNEHAKWLIEIDTLGKILTLNYVKKPVWGLGYYNKYSSKSEGNYDNVKNGYPDWSFEERLDTAIVLNAISDSRNILLENDKYKFYCDRDEFLKDYKEHSKNYTLFDTVQLFDIIKQRDDTDEINITKEIHDINNHITPVIVLRMHEYLLLDLIEGNHISIYDKTANEWISVIRKIEFSDAGICAYGGYRFYTVDGKLVIEISTWVS